MKNLEFVEIKATFAIEFDQETDGRIIADVADLDVMVYGKSEQQAGKRARAMILRRLADKIDHEEDLPENVTVLIDNCSESEATP